MFKIDVSPCERRTYQVLIAIQAIHQEKPTLEARKVTKLLRRDTTSSNDDFTSYGRSIMLMSTTSTTHLVKNEPQIYISKERRYLNLSTKEDRQPRNRLVALPNLTSHSTFHECSRGTPCQPQVSLHKQLTKPVVIISYSICLERKITLRSTSITRWNTTTESTQKKLIYSTSKNPTTFQVGIHSFNFLTKLT